MFENPPPELLDLLTRQDEVGKKFRDHIRNYNNALAMTSLGCDQDKNINRDGGGPYVFKVHGRLYHQSGSLIPNQGRRPIYSQLYIYDPQDALDYRMNHTANSMLDRTTMETLQDMLYRRHPGVQLYKQAFQITRDIPLGQNCRIALRFDHDTDRRRYNLPTATSNEIAVILPGDGDQPSSALDIILYRQGGGLRQINDLHPLYQSLHYVLLFPTGQLGWHRHIPYHGVQLPQEGNQRRNEEVKLYVTCGEYFKYHLHPHHNQFNHIFMAGKLFQEFIVEYWATTEQSHLDFIKNHQAEIRSHTYQGLSFLLHHFPEAQEI